MEQTFVVEPGIVMPRPNLGRPKGPSKYPFATMRVGDSFAFEKRLRSSVDAAASKFKSTHKGVQFSVRVNGTSARIWRIA